MAVVSTQKTMDNVYEWLVRGDPEEMDNVQSILDSARTEVLPLGGDAPILTNAITTTTKEEEKVEEIFFHLLCTCCALPSALSCDQLRETLKQFLKGDNTPTIPSAVDDTDTWWEAVHYARKQYFTARRVYFLVRIELLRIDAFLKSHPHASLVHTIVTQLLNNNLIESLIEELSGRHKHLAVPKFYSMMEYTLSDPLFYLRTARIEWEQQVLEEEILLRELLLLALYVSHERVSQSTALNTIEWLMKWPCAVVPKLFSQHALSSTAFQQLLYRATAIGGILILRLVHSTSAQCRRREPTAMGELATWTREFVLPGVWQQVDVDETYATLCCQVLDMSGILLLSWSSFLAKMHRRPLPQTSLEYDGLESDLKEIVKGSEQANGFDQLNQILQFLIGVQYKRPTLALQESTLQQLDTNYKVAVFQLVAAQFLDDTLSALGYSENLNDLDQLDSMIKLLLPLLRNANVSAHASSVRPFGSIPEFGSALQHVFDKCKDVLVEAPLPALHVFTAVCSSTTNDPTSNRSPIQLSLLEFSRRRYIGSTDKSSIWRQLPPDHYIHYVDRQQEEIDADVVCSRSFVYPSSSQNKERVVVPQGTLGLLDPTTRSTVHWLHLQSNNSKIQYNGYDVVHHAIQQVIIQQPSHVKRIIQHPFPTITAFFKWLVTIESRQFVTDICREWALARLRQWWIEKELPPKEMDNTITNLVAANVSLTILQTASRSQLESWYIRDRILCNQILYATGAKSFATKPVQPIRERGALEYDGRIDLIRILLSLLDQTEQDVVIVSIEAIAVLIQDELGMCGLMEEMERKEAEEEGWLYRFLTRVFVLTIRPVLSLLTIVSSWFLDEENPHTFSRQWLTVTVDFCMNGVMTWEEEDERDICLESLIHLLHFSQARRSTSIAQEFSKSLVPIILSDTALLKKLSEQCECLIDSSDSFTRLSDTLDQENILKCEQRIVISLTLFVLLVEHDSEALLVKSLLQTSSPLVTLCWKLVEYPSVPMIPSLAFQLLTYSIRIQPIEGYVWKISSIRSVLESNLHPIIISSFLPFLSQSIFNYPEKIQSIGSPMVSFIQNQLLSLSETQINCRVLQWLVQIWRHAWNNVGTRSSRLLCQQLYLQLTQKESFWMILIQEVENGIKEDKRIKKSRCCLQAWILELILLEWYQEEKRKKKEEKTVVKKMVEEWYSEGLLNKWISNLVHSIDLTDVTEDGDVSIDQIVFLMQTSVALPQRWFHLRRLKNTSLDDQLILKTTLSQATRLLQMFVLSHNSKEMMDQWSVTIQVLASLLESKAVGMDSIINLLLVLLSRVNQLSIPICLVVFKVLEKQFSFITHSIVSMDEKQVSSSFVELILTSTVLVSRHLIRNGLAKASIHEQQQVMVLQVQLLEHAFKVFPFSFQTSTTLSQLTWTLIVMLMNEFTYTNQVNQWVNIPCQAPLIQVVQADEYGLLSVLPKISECFRHDKEKQQLGLYLLRGLVSIVHHPHHKEWICHGLVNPCPFNAFTWLTTSLIPLLERLITIETKHSDEYGYCISSEQNVNQSIAIQSWCFGLEFAAGLVRLTPFQDDSMWLFISAMEDQVSKSLQTMRWTRVVLHQQQAIVQLLCSLSTSLEHRKEWYTRLTTNAIVMMEQCRLLLQCASVVLGQSSSFHPPSSPRSTCTQKKSRKWSVTAWPLASPRPSSPFSKGSSSSCFSYVQQTLLHRHLQPIEQTERNDLVLFYKEMEQELLQLVALLVQLLSRWTCRWNVDDQEEKIPLLAIQAPVEAMSIQSTPSVGHLGLLLMFVLDHMTLKSESSSVWNTWNAIILLFIQTYGLYQQEQDFKQEQALQVWIQDMKQRVDNTSLPCSSLELFKGLMEMITKE